MAKVSSNIARKRRHARIRATVSGTATKPRLCVFRSLSNIHAQIIDDASGVTMVSAGSLNAKIKIGILMGFGLILIQVRSPMLFSVGMYLPLETTFAIFVGGIFRWLTDRSREKGGFNDAQKARIENAGVLTASGLIAGEALCGLLVAGFRAAEKTKGHAILPDATWAGTDWLSLLVLIALAALMIRLPLRNAGSPDEPAPPTAIM